MARARAAARRPDRHTSSSEDELPGEIGGIPQVFSAFPTNPTARSALAKKTSVARAAIQPRVRESVQRESEGTTRETQRNNTILTDDAPQEDLGDADGFDGGCTDVDEGMPPTANNENPGNHQENTANAPPLPANVVEEHPREDQEGAEGNEGENTLNEVRGQGNPGENSEICQPLLDNPTRTEAFALAVAKIKGSSHVSDAAINKLLEAAVENMDVLRDFWVNRGASRLYTGCLRPALEPFIPKVYSGILLEVKHPTGIEYRHVDGLSTIPKEYQKRRGKVRVIREESYVKLEDIKRHHMGVNAKWGMTMETARNHFKNAALSVDGVQESQKGKKKFHVVTIRFGQSIYIYKIFNPLIGHPAAQTSLGELLG